MPIATRKVAKVDQQAKDYQHDLKAEEMKKRWDQLKQRKQASRGDDGES